MTDPIVLLQILWTGAVTASSYVLLTVAFSLTQKVTGLWNFAQAGTMGIAFYTMFFILNDLALPIFVALPVGAAFAAAAGIAIEAWGLDVLRARRSGNLSFFIFTLILAELVIYILTLLFGTEPQTLFATIISPVHIVGGIAISDWDLRAVGISVAALVGLQLFLSFGKEGQFLTAVADNAKLAELYGISARRAYCVTAAIAGILITLAMYLAGRAQRDHAQLFDGADPDRGDRHAAGRHGARVHGRPGVPRAGADHELLGAGDRLPLAEPADLRLPVRRHRVFPRGIHLPRRRIRAPVSTAPVQTATQEG